MHYGEGGIANVGHKTWLDENDWRGRLMNPQFKNRLSMGKVHYVSHKSKRVFL